MVKLLQKLRQTAFWSLFVAFATVSSGAFSQELAMSEGLSRGVSFYQETEKTKPLSKALDELEERFNVHLNYEVEMVKEKFVDANEKATDFKSLDEALSKLLSPISLRYERIEENYYVIYPAKNDGASKKFSRRPSKSADETSIPGSGLDRVSRASSSTLLVQDAIVRGKVVSMEDNQPLPGVNVIVKGTVTGTTTDLDGNYSLRVGDLNGTLIFSYIGYTTEEVNIAGRSIVDVAMVPDIRELSEIVITGYGEQELIHITSAIESIKPEEIQDIPVGNLGAALAGRILGLSITGGTSRPGSQPELTIRNPWSLAKDGGNNSPLFVIDDVIQIGADGLNDASLFNSLDPSEVESISILKDASAAIYGSRAANGVVIVKTKRGKVGPPRVSYSGSYAINDEAYRTKMMSAYELARYANIMNGPYGANATPGDRTRFFSQDELDFFKTINHDWLDMAWRSAYNTRHTLNVSGGNEQGTYFAGISYFNQDGNLAKLSYDKWTFRAGADINVASGFKVGLQVSGVQSKINNIYSKIGGENIENDYRNLLKAPRHVPMYLNGYPVKLPGPSGNNLSSYHFGVMDGLGNYSNDDDSKYTVNLNAEYAIPFVKGLKIRGSYSRNTSASRNEAIGTKYTLYTFDLQGEHGHIYDQIAAAIPKATTVSNDNRVRFTDERASGYQANLSLYYNRDFGLHSVTGFLSAERAESDYYQDRAWKEEPSQFTNGQFRTAFGSIDGDTNAKKAGSLGYLGRVNYNYNSKYMADFMFRSDASTKFSPENYWGTFYSLGLGWVVSEEPFFNVGAIDFLKFRYSVGLLGKDDTKPWQWRQRYTFQNGKGAVFGPDNTPAGIGMKMEASPNPDATWSNDFKQNLGIDARFLDSRLSTTVELFYNKGTNMLIERTGSVPVTVGGTVAAQNWAKVDFFGYEFSLGWDDKFGAFNYGIDTRFSWYDNKVKQSNFNETEILYPWNARPGESNDNGKWGYDVLGMFRTQEEIDAYVEQYNITSVFGTPASDLKPGMLYYRDIRGELNVADGSFAGPDGVIDENDQIRLSKKASNHYGFGVTLKAGYKGFSFDCVIAGSFGGWSEIDGRNRLERNVDNLFQNGPAYWADVYDPELNPDGIYPNPYWEDINLKPVSDFWRVSSFRMRMRNFSVNYTIPRNLTERLKIGSARIVFSGVNPLNLYNPFSYKDSDGSWENYPVLRTYSLGVNVTL